MLNKQQILTAMSLDAAGVTAALQANGFTGDKVLSAAFHGLTKNGSFVYHCTYPDQDTGQPELCVVYVLYQQTMGLVADY